MLSFFGNHFRLSYRLFMDKRVNIISKLVFILIPLIYVIYPNDLIEDYYPLLGLLDDLAIFIVSSIMFIYISPYSVVHEHRNSIEGNLDESSRFPFEKYRYSQESRDFSLGLGILLVMFLAGGEFGGIMIIIGMIGSYRATVFNQNMMLTNMVEINEMQYPEIYCSYQQAQSHLPKIDVKLYTKQSPIVNAYTFGFKKPYPIVLHSALVEKMKPEELQAIIGHEMGHIIFGHTKLNSILFHPSNRLAQIIFLKWSRSCEYSADAIAWIASGMRAKNVVTSLIRLVAGLKNEVNVDAFLQQSNKVEDAFASLAEFGGTHPTIKKRIRRVIALDKKG